jgi:hypothetical protein
MSGILTALAGIKTAIATAVDEYFNLTTLLLNTSSTNGAQNNTFLDSSTNNFTITRNGNTTQGTFTPFSQTGWGNYFNGSGSGPYLRFGSSSALTFGTGDFTIEFWVYFISINDSTISYLYDMRDANGTGSFFVEEPANTWTYRDGAGNLVTTGMTSSTFTANQWYHVAVCRASGVINFYINGTKVSANPADTSNYATSYISIMSRHVSDGGNNNTNSYTSNFRVVKGTALYTANFTPQTTPLTAITNTSLLTCQSNRFVDNSANALAATVDTGQPPSVQAFSPFAPTAAYDTAVVGGSGYFSSSSDYLTTTGTALGSGAFTIELWIYPTSVPNAQNAIYSNGAADNSTTCVFSILSGRTLSFYSNGIAATSTATVPLNAWSHIAAVRSGTTLTVYLNGVSVATATISNDISSTAVQIGHGYGGILNTFLGYYSGLRTLVGTALYTTTFTPPTAPPTAITNTSLLTNFTNSGIYDSTAKNVLETVGNAQVSTTQAKWGTTSMYFDGTGDNLAFPKNELFNFGTGDFTIEFWFYPPSVSYGAIMYSTNNGSKTDTFAIYSYGSGQSPANSIVALVTASGGGAWSLFNNQLIGATTAATWQHVALVRNGSTFKGYMNGVAGFTVTSSSAIASFNGFSIASNGASADYLTGYIDDLRITRYARYTADFTPPAAAFPLQ